MTTDYLQLQFQQSCRLTSGMLLSAASQEKDWSLGNSYWQDQTKISVLSAYSVFAAIEKWRGSEKGKGIHILCVSLFSFTFFTRWNKAMPEEGHCVDHMSPRLGSKGKIYSWMLSYRAGNPSKLQDFMPLFPKAYICDTPQAWYLGDREEQLWTNRWGCKGTKICLTITPFPKWHLKACNFCVLFLQHRTLRSCF